mgnify:CR=1 FL=1
MKASPDEIYRQRKQFFDDRAGKWIDMWYKNPKTGKYDKHQKDFERLFSLLPLRRGDHVLDAGCGVGVLVPFILDVITDQGMLYELDFSEKMIEENKRLHTGDPIRHIVSDAEKAPLDDNSCDMVICFSAFPHFHDKARAVRKLARILKPQGIFVVAHFASADGIKKHHASCRAVMHDVLPERAEMYQLFKNEHLNIETFIDEPGFYYVMAKK